LPPPSDVPPVDETTMVDIGGPAEMAAEPPAPVQAAPAKDSGCALAARPSSRSSAEGNSSQNNGLFVWGSLLASAWLGRRRLRLGGRAPR
ncbi:MAG TPA: hypothetical protein VJU61_19820, partial [Polyangiaceae bacterium]|nr:hypothetical protein [Polyangiaceae bacterium]